MKEGGRGGGGSATTLAAHVTGKHEKAKSFRCAQCERKVKRNPAAVLAKVQTALVAAQMPGYTMKTCPVSGKALPATPTDTLIAGQLVRLCCDDCRATADKNPTATLAKLQAPATKKN